MEALYSTHEEFDFMVCPNKEISKHVTAQSGSECFWTPYSTEDKMHVRCNDLECMYLEMCTSNKKQEEFPRDRR